MRFYLASFLYLWLCFSYHWDLHKMHMNIFLETLQNLIYLQRDFLPKNQQPVWYPCALLPASWLDILGELRERNISSYFDYWVIWSFLKWKKINYIKKIEVPLAYFDLAFHLAFTYTHTLTHPTSIYIDILE